MSRGLRWLIGLAVIALGVVLVGTVSLVAGVIVVAIGTLILPWFAGMGSSV